MYFKDVDWPDCPKTATGSHHWDHVGFMDTDRSKEDIAQLIATGEADTPIYNFQDVRPGGWRRPGVTVTGFREDKPKHVALGEATRTSWSSTPCTPSTSRYIGVIWRNSSFSIQYSSHAGSP